VTSNCKNVLYNDPCNTRVVYITAQSLTVFLKGIYRGSTEVLLICVQQKLSGLQLASERLQKQITHAKRRILCLDTERFITGENVILKYGNNFLTVWLSQ
jgi:hypothetical protein